MTSNQKPVPMVHSPDLSNRSATPPPPPPPLKDHNRMTESKERNAKQDRQTNQTPTQESRPEQQHENLNRSKTHDYQPGDTPVKTSYKTFNYQPGDTPVKTPYKTFNSERLIKKTIKLATEESVVFSPLPDINKYSEHFSPSVADFNIAFYCNALENQVS